jgi:hypothetical protein
VSGGDGGAGQAGISGDVESREPAAGSAGWGRWWRPGLARALLIVAATVLVLLVAVPLLFSAGTPATSPSGPPAPSASPSASGPVLGPDGVPTSVDGQPVLRAASRASFPASGSFMIGGLVSMPDDIPPCPQRFGISDAEQHLVPYCWWQAIDGIHMAPKGQPLDDYRGLAAVARVHADDPEALECPVAVRASCRAALVVESIVWASGIAPTSTPRLGPTGGPPNPASPVTPVTAGTRPPPPAPPSL